MRNRQFWVFVAMLLVAGCGSKQSNQAEELASDTGAAPRTAAPRRPYVVNDAGIRFDPPRSWDAARIEVISRSGKEADELHPGALYVVSFDYKAEQPAHHNKALINFYVLRKAAWKGALNDSLEGELVDSTSDWVFVAAMPEANPYRRGLLDADQFEAMRLSLEQVREAFSIENGGPADATLSAESRRN